MTSVCEHHEENESQHPLLTQVIFSKTKKCRWHGLTNHCTAYLGNNLEQITNHS